jgi:AAA domain, putative AbiEii toxin, Type IV TA system/AAA ATPase domain
MIDGINIQNFRCFASLQLSGLQRINVIVGRNSSGKTALLEAIFLSGAPGAPSIIFQLRALRHLGTQVQIAGDPVGYRALWEDLFHWFNQEKTISIEVLGTNGDSRSWRASYSDIASQVLPLGNQPINPTFLPQITFEWQRSDQSPVTTRPLITSAGLVVEGMVTASVFPTLLFAPHSPDSPEEHARRFSELSKAGEIGPILKGLRTEFPFVKSLSLEYYSHTPAVYADVSVNGDNRKMPVGLLSDGVNKLMGILLGIATSKGGTVLIDQIEDGLYYDRLESIWKLIYEFAAEAQCQIFATTHSMECLKAMLPAMKRHKGNFQLLRAERENGESIVTPVKGKFLESALEQNFEVR